MGEEGCKQEVWELELHDAPKMPPDSLLKDLRLCTLYAGRVWPGRG